MNAAVSGEVRRSQDADSVQPRTRQPIWAGRKVGSLGRSGTECLTDSGYRLGCPAMADVQKRQALRAQGTLYTAPDQVKADVFSAYPEFFDSEDKLQVRYELLRAAAHGEMTISEACRALGSAVRPSKRCSAPSRHEGWLAWPTPSEIARVRSRRPSKWSRSCVPPSKSNPASRGRTSG